MSYTYESVLLDVEKIKENVIKKMKKGDISRLNEILGSFGDLKDNKLLLSNIECWEDYNSYYQVMDFIERYYGIEDAGYEAMTEDTILMSIDTGSNADDVASELGIDLDSTYDDDEDYDDTEDDE